MPPALPGGSGFRSIGSLGGRSAGSSPRSGSNIVAKVSAPAARDRRARPAIYPSRLCCLPDSFRRRKRSRRDKRDEDDSRSPNGRGGGVASLGGGERNGDTRSREDSRDGRDSPAGRGDRGRGGDPPAPLRRRPPSDSQPRHRARWRPRRSPAPAPPAIAAPVGRPRRRSDLVAIAIIAFTRDRDEIAGRARRSRAGAGDLSLPSLRSRVGRCLRRTSSMSSIYPSRLCCLPEISCPHSFRRRPPSDSQPRHRARWATASHPLAPTRSLRRSLSEEDELDELG